MANSSSVTSSLDRRNIEPNTMKVWEVTVTFLIEAGGGSDEMSHEVVINGLLREAFIAVGAAGGISGTVNVDFDDSNDVEFDTNASLAELSETVVAFNTRVGIPVTSFTIRVDPTDDPAAGQDDWEIAVTCRGT